MLGMVGVEETEAKADAEMILALETEMAGNTLDKVERRDPNKTYNPKAVAELSSLLEGFDWKAVMTSHKVS